MIDKHVLKIINDIVCLKRPEESQGSGMCCTEFIYEGFICLTISGPIARGNQTSILELDSGNLGVLSFFSFLSFFFFFFFHFYPWFSLGQIIDVV